MTGAGPPDLPTDQAPPLPPLARESPRPPCELVVIAASAGGIDAVGTILAALPPDFPAAIAVVQHRAMTLPNLLPRILGRRAPTRRVVLAAEGARLEPGTVYVAPPDRHLTVTAGRTLHLTDGRRIKHLRSSANPLLESAAATLDGRLIAVVLTGSGTDATDGVQSVHARGGIVIAQDPTTAAHGSMPKSAIASGAVRYVARLEEIAPLLVRLGGAGRAGG